MFYREWINKYFKNKSFSSNKFNNIKFPKEEVFTSKNAPKLTPELAMLYTFLSDTLKNHLILMLQVHREIFPPTTRLVIKYPGVFWGPKGDYYTLQGLTGHLDLREYFHPDFNNPVGYIANYKYKDAYRLAIRSYLDVIKKYPNVELSYTAAEKLDGDGGDPENIPQTFFDIILDEAVSAKVPLNIENALDWNLPNKDLMNNFKINFYKAGVADATLLRIQKLGDNDAPAVIKNIKNLLNK